jgi:hypothetical protein
MFMGGDDLRDWAREASPGTSLCLGVASSVPASTQPALRSLSDAGVIDVARRRVGPERYSFVVQRRSARYIDRQPAMPRRGGMRVRRAGTVERRILKLLLIAVARDLPCPTNATIAKLVGLRDELAASYRLRKLQERGLIRIAVPADPRLHRVVTIVASGKTTRGGAR